MPKARREREIAHTRGDILRAAARALARQGFEATTIHDIAKEAGYTAQSLYAYFKGKQEIVDGLMAMMAADLAGSFEARTPPGLTFPQRFEILVGSWVEFAGRWREALGVLFALKAAGKPITSGRGPRLGGDFFIELLTTWLRSAAGPRDLGGYDAQTAACILKGILYGLFLDWLRSGKKELPAERMKAAVGVFLYGVTGGGGGGSPPGGRAR